MNREKFNYEMNKRQAPLNTDHRLDILNASMNACDWTTKSMIIMEECSELAQAVSKGCRYNDKETRIDILEEMADVMICMEFLKMHYGIPEDILNKAMDVKLRREEDRRCQVTGNGNDKE